MTRNLGQTVGTILPAISGQGGSDMPCDFGQVVGTILLAVGGLCVLLIVVAVFVSLLRQKPLAISGPKLGLVLLFVCLTFGVVPKSLELFGVVAELERSDQAASYARAALAEGTGKPANEAFSDVVVESAEGESVMDLVNDAGGESDG